MSQPCHVVTDGEGRSSRSGQFAMSGTSRANTRFGSDVAALAAVAGPAAASRVGWAPGGNPGLGRRSGRLCGAGRGGFRRLFFEHPQPMWVLDAETRALPRRQRCRRRQVRVLRRGVRGADHRRLRRDVALLAVDFVRARAGKSAFSGPATACVTAGSSTSRSPPWPTEFDGRPGILTLINDVTERNRLDGSCARAPSATR